MRENNSRTTFTATLTFVAFAFAMFLTAGLFAQNTFPASGFAGIGTTSPDAALTILNDDVDFATGNLRLSAYAGINPGTSDNYVGQVRFEKYRGTVAAPLKAENGDRVAGFLAAAYDGATIQRSAVFGFRVDGPTGSNDVPIGFFVQTGDRSNNKPERLLINSDGQMQVVDLGGTGTRMVVADATGFLSTQPIPSGGGGTCWTEVVDTCWSDKYIAVGTASPLAFASVSVLDNEGIAIHAIDTSGGGIGVYGQNDHLTAAFDGAGVLGRADTYDYFGFGAVGRGGYVGTRGLVTPIGDTLQQYFGAQGIVSGGTGNTDGSVNFGVYGFADGADPTQTGGTGVATAIGDWAVYADGEAFSTVAWTASDRKLKNNIRDIEYGIDAIMQLEPKAYEYNSGNVVNARAGVSYLGFVAQDLETVIPEVVSSTKAPVMDFDSDNSMERGIAGYETIKVVNQDGLLPVIVKAIQEQQATIMAQAEEIADLKDLVVQLNNTSSEERKSQLIEDAFGHKLFQSVPNPAHNSARIDFYLNDNTNAEIKIVEIASGRMVRTVTVNGEGYGNVSVDISNLASGLYSYTLVVNGEMTATKTMVVE